MTELGCQQLRQVSAELALGALVGRERAQAVAHIEHCSSCREEVHALARVSDHLVNLIPGADAPLGFETRVMSRLGFSQGVPRIVPLRKVAAAVILMLVVGATGWSIGQRSAGVSPRPEEGTRPLATPLRSASFLANGHIVGTVFAYQGRPWWVYVAVDTDRADATISCQLVRRDGTVVSLGTFALTHGYGYWGVPSQVDPTDVRSARLVTTDGHLLATAAFTA